MNLKIGAKILEFRKAKNITQEQLAEALGVSIAAVSKWECAVTYPDITLLPAIASYFEVSIDALIDYQVQPNVLQDYRNTLQKFVQVSDYQSGLPIAEKALKQYPNDFQLLMSKLQKYLFGMAFGFAMVTESLGKCFRDNKKMQYVVDLQLMHASFLSGFTHDTPNYCDLLCSMSYHNLAKLQKEIGDLQSMWEGIEKIVYHAVRFDKQPSYALESVKFMNGLDGWLANNSSENACHMALNRIKSDFSEFQADVRYISALNELESAAKDKRESGIWG